MSQKTGKWFRNWWRQASNAGPWVQGDVFSGSLNETLGIYVSPVEKKSVLPPAQDIDIR